MDEKEFFSQLQELIAEEDDAKTEIFLKKYLAWADRNQKYDFYVVICQNLISLYRSEKSYEKASDVGEDMLMLMEELHMEDETAYADALVSVAAVCRESGKAQEAAELYKKAQPVFENAGDEAAKDLAYMELLLGLGECGVLLGNSEDALHTYEQAAGLIQSQYGKNEAYRVVTANCAAICDTLKDPEKAAWFRRELTDEHDGE